MSQPFKTILAIDFETAWCRKSGYSLSVMTTEEYIRDERFKAWGVCIHEYGTDKITNWYRHDELPRIFATYDWSKTAIIAQNALFDASILAWVYDVHPCFIFDTLSMARAKRGVEIGNSLAMLAKAFELPDKGGDLYLSEGYFDKLPAEVEHKLAEYCKHDVWLCEQVFERLIEGYPAKELRLVDMTIKMYTEAKLVLDTPMLVDALHEEKESREALLKRLQLTDSVLASNDQFAEALRMLGVEPPTKKKKPTAKTPNPVGVNFAFAKTDAMFQAMLNGENEDVALLCEARLKVKSTTERTRAQRFLDISKRGPLPVPLSYFGAGTGRWTASKGSAINMQNLKRGSFLRKAIMAPEGHSVVVGDLSQIEPRVLAWLADYDDLLDIFRSGQDVYAQFGAQMFNVPGMTKERHPALRQSAKSALLGCGFMLGWAAFASQLLVGFLGAPPVRYDKDFAKSLGVTAQSAEKFLRWEDNVKKLEEIPHTCTMRELVIHCLAAKAIIDKYRATAEPVVALWQLFGTLIQYSLYEGNEYTHKCVTFRKGEIVLPSGMSLLYPDLKPSKDDKGRLQWTYGRDNTKLHAGKITNNVVQGTARCVMTDGMLQTAKRYRPLMTVHDEFCIMVPEAEAKEAKAFMYQCMTTNPKWMPGVPLESDVGYARRYGDAK